MDQCLVQRAARRQAVEVDTVEMDSLAGKYLYCHILDHIDPVLVVDTHQEEGTAFEDSELEVSNFVEDLAVRVVGFDWSCEEVDSTFVLELAERYCSSVGGSQLTLVHPMDQYLMTH